MEEYTSKKEKKKGMRIITQNNSIIFTFLYFYVHILSFLYFRPILMHQSPYQIVCSFGSKNGSKILDPWIDTTMIARTTFKQTRKGNNNIFLKFSNQITSNEHGFVIYLYKIFLHTACCFGYHHGISLVYFNFLDAFCKDALCIIHQ